MAVRRTARQVAASRRNLIAARKKRKRASRKTVRTTKSGGLTYQTTSQRGAVFKNRTAHLTKAYNGANLAGYAYSVTNHKKNTATIEDLYVQKQHRGKGVSRKILLHQAHAVKGQKIAVTHLRSEGGNKVASRTKIKGTGTVHVAKSKSNSDYVTGLTETAYGFQAAGHASEYKRQQKKLARAKRKQVKYGNA